MNESVTGGCLCGGVRFRIRGEIGHAGYCHCADCRKVTGSAFNVSVGVDKSAFEITSGTPKGYTASADSGQELTRHFCPACGGPIYTSSPAYPERVFVKAGAIDDPSTIKPGIQKWTASQVPWAFIDPALPATARD